MGYKEYFTVRLLNSFLVLIAVSLIAYAMFIGLGNPVERLRNQLFMAKLQTSSGADPTQISQIIEQKIQKLEEAFGLSKPWYVQMGLWVWRCLTLNFPPTWFYRSGTDVKILIMERLPNTLTLLGTATLATVLVGVVLGLKAAVKHGSLLDKSVIMSGLAGYSFASWWVGMVLLYIAKSVIGLRFSSGGIVIESLTEIFTDPDVGYRFLLSTFALTLVAFGGWALVVRNIMIGVLAEDYITTARAKGLSERKVLYGHALKSAAPPIITMIALAFAGVFSGAILTETVFNWPGMGLLYWDALQAQDLPILMALTFISTFLIVAANLIADLLYGVFDPRVRVRGRKA